MGHTVTSGIIDTQWLFIWRPDK